MTSAVEAFGCATQDGLERETDEMAGADQFDAYYVWLGIPPEEQPAHFYRLLDVKTFESNPEAIDIGFQRRMAFLRSIKPGERSALVERIKHELNDALRCLLSPAKKQAYDAELQQRFAQRATPPSYPPMYAQPAYTQPTYAQPAYTVPYTVPYTPPLQPSAPQPAPVPYTAAPVRTVRKGYSLLQRFVPIGFGLVCMALVALIGYRILTQQGTIVVEVDEPDAVIKVLDASGTVELEQPATAGENTLSVTPGPHRLLVQKPGFRDFRANFELARGDMTQVSVALKPERAPTPSPNVATVKPAASPTATPGPSVAVAAPSGRPSASPPSAKPTGTSLAMLAIAELNATLPAAGSTSPLNNAGTASTPNPSSNPAETGPSPTTGAPPLNTAAAEAARTALVGTPAPEIEGAQWLSGGPTSLAEHRGRPVLLCFWSAWSSTCARSFPFINALEKRYAPQGFGVISITPPSSFRWNAADKRARTVSAGDPAADALAMVEFADYHELRSPIGVVADRTFGQKYVVTGIPSFALIDGAGEIRLVRLGAGSTGFNLIETELRRVLKLPPISSEEMISATVIVPTQEVLGPLLPSARAAQEFLSRNVRLAKESQQTTTHRVGDLVSLGYSFTNEAATAVPAVPSGSQPPRALVQGFLERLGPDSTIAALPRSVSRTGNKYVLGGPLYTMPSTMPAGMKILLSRTLDTQGYPPGRYRFELVHVDALNNNVLQTTSCDFELIAAANGSSMAPTSNAATTTGPTPRLAYKGERTIDSPTGDRRVIELMVTNRSEFPDSIFAPRESGNDSQQQLSRTMVRAIDAETNRSIYINYRIKSSVELGNIAFALAQELPRPKRVYLLMHDMQRNTTARSNEIDLPPAP